MSILIKGMEMPPSDKALIMAYKDGRFIWIDLESEKTYQYEAVEVPTPHGRLIDADDANSYAYDILETCHDMHPWEAAREMQKIFFRDAPTVIEAEEDKP